MYMFGTACGFFCKNVLALGLIAGHYVSFREPVTPLIASILGAEKDLFNRIVLSTHLDHIMSLILSQ